MHGELKEVDLIRTALTHVFLDQTDYLQVTIVSVKNPLKAFQNVM